MNLIEASVTSNFDIFESGYITVSSLSFIGTRDCKYVSPYGALHNPVDGQKGGFFAIPSIGQTVLIAQSESADIYYFMGVVHDNDLRSGDDSISEVAEAGAIPSDVYQLLPGAPQRVILSDAYGNALVLSHAYSYDQKNIESHKAELRTATKRVSLEDTPLVNRISIENEFHDGFFLASKQHNNSDLGERHMLLRTQGPLQQFSEHGVDTIVFEGFELNIKNKSTGGKAEGTNKFGNVNISSEKKDINLTARGSASKVMIRTKGSDGVVQINSDGSIIIKAPSDSIFIEGDNINIKAASNLNIEAGASINIKAGTQATMTGAASTVNLTAGFAALDGPIVNLAPVGGAGTAGPADSAPDILNDYEE